MNNIGKMYLGRSGIPLNYPEAFQWFRKAAELRETDAMNVLAVGYEMGMPGLPKDMKQAELWYRKSAALGNQNGKQALMRFGGWQNFDLNGIGRPISPGPYYLCLTACDMRKSFDSLAALVRNQMELDPLGGHLYVFWSRRKDRVKNIVLGQRRLCHLGKAVGGRHLCVAFL